mmetsp:Transcript_25840/g.41977  ORF Transcript_25840/g.41977 Transcript_25840/m.41977 type:complete len:318 (+) Transcript_25840:102-1055(+)|eukprot:CAMPEP_0196131294 /NCGR_PEP_ID=MMETSP0910-20130528/1371_1 /TAXON_ID=49265 /ORGANISM="Thalassiosira rotula, Strain GSO102" /LENGTH=317 /DNA_ID=CAMNT_0041390757 /DNA_START=127 /DNA_END=1080 /DNA_ORIENTATION=-
MTTPRGTILSFRRILLLTCIGLLTSTFQHHHQCHAFSSTCPSSYSSYSSLTFKKIISIPRQQQSGSFKKTTNIIHNSSSSSTRRIEELFGKATSLSASSADENSEEDRSRPKIVVIKTPEDHVKFLEEDDRLCVIKFYANWCKSCQKFGVKYRHLAFEEGDRIIAGSSSPVHTGEVRFAEVEYTASAKLCKSLKVKKLPTVHMFRKGEGKIADMTCKPSLFHLVEEEMHRLMEGGESRLLEEEMVVAVGEKSLPKPKEEKVVVGDPIAVTNNNNSNGNVTSTSFDGLADEIMTSLGMKEEEKVGTKKEKNSWFPFSF